jgi:glycosyltransferase involved in cell wall biosynthesis
MRTPPDVSVIIPTYNRAHLVFAAIASVIAQRATNYELIVIDDGSTDDTWGELERTAKAVNAEHGDRMSIRTMGTENRGVAAARNRGVAMAAAPLIAFLDSDDLWGPDKIACQTAYMRAHPQCAIMQTDEYWLRDGSRVNPGLRHRKTAGDIFVDSLRTCLVSPSAVMIRAALFREMSGFDEDFAAAEDYDLWLRILMRHEIGFIAEFHATRRSGHKGQLSAAVPAIDRLRILALLKLLDGHDLNESQRRAVCVVLAEKCAIYAKGLIRRGREDLANLILGFGASAAGAWCEDGAAACVSEAAAAMRAQIRRNAMVSGER